MDNVRVVELKEWCLASFDLIDFGFTIDGPAKIIILKEAVNDQTASDEYKEKMKLQQHFTAG